MHTASKAKVWEHAGFELCEYHSKVVHNIFSSLPLPPPPPSPPPPPPPSPPAPIEWLAVVNAIVHIHKPA